MIATAGRLLRPLLPLLLGTFLALGMAGAASAADPSASTGAPAGATLTATPAVIGATVQPGNTGTTTLTLQAGQALDVTVDPEGLGQSPDDGSFTYLPADQDKSAYSARPYISVDPASFRMETGTSKEIKVTFTVPAGAGDGERYAILKVTGQPAGSQGNVAFSTALGVSVVLNLGTVTLQPAAKIQDLAVAKLIPGQPLSVTNNLMATGKGHFGAPPNQITETVTLRNAKGDTVATAKSTLTGNSLIPGFYRQFKVAVDSSQLSAGTYQVVVAAALADGTVLDSATASLDVSGDQAVAGATGGAGDNTTLLLTGAIVALSGAGIAATIGFAVLGRRRRATGQQVSRG